MINRQNFAVLSALASILATAILIYIGQEDYAGYALLLGFGSMVIMTPVSKEEDGPVVVGWFVDRIDLSFMEGKLTGKYTVDTKLVREHFVNIAGQAPKISYSQAGYLVQALYKAHGVNGGKPKPPSKYQLYWRKLRDYMNQEVDIAKYFKRHGSSEEEGTHS